MSKKVGQNNKSLKNQPKIGLFFTIVLLSLTLNSIQSWAQSPDSSYMQLTDQVTLEWINVNSTEFIYPVNDAVQKIVVSPWFLGRLPSFYGIIVDGAWTKSTGYYSSTLKTTGGDHAGAPAILLAPSELDQSRSLSLITHELTHLMHTHLRPQSDVKEESWIREGVAMLAEWIVTGEYGIRKMNGSIIQAFKNPETSLTEPLDPNHDKYLNVQTRTAQYGHILQYFLYIYRLCGKTELLNKLITSTSTKTGIELVDEVLKSMKMPSKVCSSFETSFKMFSIARFKQDIGEEEYVYRTSAEPVIRDEPVNLPSYSSGAYKLKTGKKCLAGEEAWGTSVCIHIRFK